MHPTSLYLLSHVLMTNDHHLLQMTTPTFCKEKLQEMGAVVMEGGSDDKHDKCAPCAP